MSINIIVETEGDPKGIDPDEIEEILYAAGVDVYRVSVVQVEDVTA